jgi:5-methylcytosine-specific restriction protein A
MGSNVQEIFQGRGDKKRQGLWIKRGLPERALEQHIIAMGSFISQVTEEELKKERAKARELRQSPWWKRRRAEGVCYFCRREFSPKDLTMDHIVPLIRGGRSMKGNTVPACKECNNRKKYLLPVEWEEYLERLKTEED